MTVFVASRHGQAKIHRMGAVRGKHPSGHADGRKLSQRGHIVMQRYSASGQHQNLQHLGAKQLGV